MNPKPAITRLLSLDVFRGLTIALMILVNSPGNRTSFSWLAHSEWNGCTFADLVFPFFIIIVGMSTVLGLTSLKAKGVSRRQLLIAIFKRSVYIFSIGLLLNAFPTHFDLYTLRIPGVLQRIALCYFFASILFLTTTPRTQIILAISLLLSYWLLIHSFIISYPLTMHNNIVGYLDKIILSSRHLYTPEFDPEGILSTLPAIASALLGNMVGIFLLSSRTKTQQLQGLIVAGIALVICGGLWDFIFPINKAIWSSAYVLWTGGIAVLIFAICFALIEIKQWRYWSKPFMIFGQNSMLVYVLHVLFLKIQAIIKINHAGDLINLRLYITDVLFGNLTPEYASFYYAISYTLFWLLFLICFTRYRSTYNLVGRVPKVSSIIK